MFGKRELLKNGAVAKAVVTEARPLGGMPSRAGGYSATVYDLKLRVHFDDGSSSDCQRTVGGFIRGTDLCFNEGDIVPVRFDPADRSKVEVDTEAMEKQREQEKLARRQQAVSRAEQELAGSTSREDAQSHSVAAERRARKAQARKNKPQQQAFRELLVEKLERQHQQGLLTDEEFEEKKAKVRGGH